MALRVARGLFRLWLVLSVLWIGFVGYLTWKTWPNIDEEVEEAMLKMEIRMQRMGDTPFPTEYKKELRERHKAHLEAVQYRSVGYASVFALAPLFIWALGSALVWAFRGFR